MKRRRVILRICVLLLLGAVVNVAVAWACSLWSAFPAGLKLQTPSEEHDTWWKARVIDGAVENVSSVWELRGFGCRYQVMEGNHHAPPDANLVEFATTPSDVAIVATAGLPLSAVGGERWDLNVPYLSSKSFLPKSNSCFHRHAFSVGSAKTGSNPFRIIGLQILWPGFAINTVFYAGVLWLLFVAPFALRRTSRRRRGLCVKCGYDLRGSVDADACPECGNADVRVV